MTAVPPHLAHLPTWRGLPVPYINAWGDETDEQLSYIAFDHNIGRDAVFNGGRRGEGKPDFTRQCFQRAREIAVHGKCQVCRRVLATDRRYLFLGVSDAFVDVDGVGETAVVNEPWLCARCVPYVMHACPGIRRRISRDELAVIHCTRSEIALSSGWHDKYGPGRTAIMWAKIVPIEYTPVPIELAAA